MPKPIKMDKETLKTWLTQQRNALQIAFKDQEFEFKTQVNKALDIFALALEAKSADLAKSYSELENRLKLLNAQRIASIKSSLAQEVKNWPKEPAHLIQNSAFEVKPLSQQFAQLANEFDAASELKNADEIDRIISIENYKNKLVKFVANVETLDEKDSWAEKIPNRKWAIQKLKNEIQKNKEFVISTQFAELKNLYDDFITLDFSIHALVLKDKNLISKANEIYKIYQLNPNLVKVLSSLITCNDFNIITERLNLMQRYTGLQSNIDRIIQSGLFSDEIRNRLLNYPQQILSPNRFPVPDFEKDINELDERVKKIENAKVKAAELLNFRGDLFELLSNAEVEKLRSIKAFDLTLSEETIIAINAIHDKAKKYSELEGQLKSERVSNDIIKEGLLALQNKGLPKLRLMSELSLDEKYNCLLNMKRAFEEFKNALLSEQEKVANYPEFYNTKFRNELNALMKEHVEEYVIKRFHLHLTSQSEVKAVTTPLIHTFQERMTQLKAARWTVLVNEDEYKNFDLIFQGKIKAQREDEAAAIKKMMMKSNELLDMKEDPTSDKFLQASNVYLQFEKLHAALTKNPGNVFTAEEFEELRTTKYQNYLDGKQTASEIYDDIIQKISFRKLVVAIEELITKKKESLANQVKTHKEKSSLWSTDKQSLALEKATIDIRESAIKAFDDRVQVMYEAELSTKDKVRLMTQEMNAFSLLDSYATRIFKVKEDYYTGTKKIVDSLSHANGFPTMAHEIYEMYINESAGQFEDMHNRYADSILSTRLRKTEGALTTLIWDTNDRSALDQKDFTKGTGCLCSLEKLMSMYRKTAKENPSSFRATICEKSQKQPTVQKSQQDQKSSAGKVLKKLSIPETQVQPAAVIVVPDSKSVQQQPVPTVPATQTPADQSEEAKPTPPAAPQQGRRASR